MLLFPHAKINIGLQVLRKRADGFHDLSLSFVPLFDLTDILEIVPAVDAKDSFELVDVATVNIEETLNKNLEFSDNIVIQARDLLRQYTNVPPCKIYLHKHIPIGAGLGGGSSDAAYTLKGLNEIFNLGLSKEKLQELCRMLGSDCAFFLEDSARMASGRGDVFSDFPKQQFELSQSELSQSPKKVYDIVIIKPSFSISTAEAYKNVIPNSTRTELKELLKLPIEQWKDNIENDFEYSLKEKYPQISEIKNELYNSGAIYASLSGSGSAIYGIFNSLTSQQITSPLSFLSKSLPKSSTSKILPLTGISL
jgi:4-diphosphocytidyl-2-C-methyl-D-erythritol kinase